MVDELKRNLKPVPLKEKISFVATNDVPFFTSVEYLMRSAYHEGPHRKSPPECVTSSLSGPRILLSTYSQNTLGLYPLHLKLS